MLDPRVQSALNDQIQKEFASGYLYLAMAAYCEDLNLPGFAHWLRKQAEEEQGHAMRLYGHVVDRGGRVLLQGIEQPPAEFDSPLGVFEKTLAHEQAVTASIHRLYEIAGEAKDYAAQSMLKWFIDEQVEEENSAAQIVEQLKRAGTAGHALLMMDRALAQR